MIEEIDRLLDDYRAWLKDKTTLRQIEDWVEITTPYLDRHNDYLQIYARRSNGGFLLTDDGYILNDLRHSGCALESKRRRELLKMTLGGLGVQLQGEQLTVQTSPNNFAQRKHNLVQAMLAVNDLFCVAMPLVASLFLEDLAAWLDEHDIRYTPTVKFTGQSGYDHVFDFVIPKSRVQPERIIKAINRPGRDTAEAAAFAWFDTRHVRPQDSRAYAFLNDSEQPVSSAVVEAIRSYDLHPVLWGQRESVREELAA